MTSATVSSADEFRSGLESCCRLLASFSPDRAKEAADALAQARRGTTHAAVTSALSQLCTGERLYFGLAFLAPRRGFFHKDNPCKQVYEGVRATLSGLSSSAATDGAASSTSANVALLPAVATHLSSFAACRLRLMEVYERAAW